MSMSIREDHLHFAILLTLCGVVFFLGLGIRDFWNIDEGMHAAIAQNMLISADWITPVYHGEAFLDKPPLFNWANAISFAVFGVNEIAARIPSAIAGLGCVIVTYLLGRRIFDAKTGLVAAVILATSPIVIVLSRVVQYDMVFAFFTTLSLYYFASGVIEQRKLFFIAFYVAVALAFMTKGPLAIVLTGLVIGVYLLQRERIRIVLLMQLPLGIVIFLMIVIPWFALMEKANPGYLHYFLYQQHLANFLSGASDYKPRHIEPVYYYLPVVVFGLLPWSLMLPQAIARAVIHHSNFKAGMATFLLIWLVGIFLFFTAATSKLGSYLLPLTPAAALLVGHYWREFLDQPNEKARIGILLGSGIVFIFLVLLTGYAIVEKPWNYLHFTAGIAVDDFNTAVVLLTAMFGLAFLFTWLHRNNKAFIAFAAILPVFFMYVLFTIMPGVNPYKGSREIALELDKLLPPEEKFLYLGHHIMGTARFYTGRDGVEVYNDWHLDQFLKNKERVYALVQTRARSETDAFQGNYHVIKVIGNKAIVSNRPDKHKTAN